MVSGFEQIFLLLFSFAVNHTPYEWPIDEGPPKIVYYSEDTTNDQVTQNGYHGGYHAGTIYLPNFCKEGKEQLKCNGLYIHEAVHYLQDINDVLNRNDCDELEQNEVEAYTVHHKFLAQRGYVIRHFQMSLPDECVKRWYEKRGK